MYVVTEEEMFRTRMAMLSRFPEHEIPVPLTLPHPNPAGRLSLAENDVMLASPGFEVMKTRVRFVP